MRTRGIGARLQRLDAYAKPLEDVRTKTLIGGVLTLITAALIAMLCVGELLAYNRLGLQTELAIDQARAEKMDIYLDITLKNAPCVVLGVALADTAGEHQAHVEKDLVKQRLDRNGRPVSSSLDDPVPPPPRLGQDGNPYCGSCYGGVAPAGGCCNTCDDVHRAYGHRGWAFTDPDAIEQCVREGYVRRMRQQRGEGCRLHGHVLVNKVPGVLLLSGGETVDAQGSLVHRSYDYLPPYDFAHRIHSLRFGDAIVAANAAQKAAADPLAGVVKEDLNADTRFQYYIKVVGSEVRRADGSVAKSNEYAVTELAKHGAEPGIRLSYEISPMRMVYTESRASLTGLFSRLCAIIGGVTTIAGLLDAAIFQAGRALRQKEEIGKQS
ncbi:ER-derived vesicles protein erv46 [Coemansia sp. Benny D115]|nr:ER-derived vesicles protein erv46 [Coemansia sp. Benny D115]